MNSVIDVSNSFSKRARKLWLDNIPNVILYDDLISKYKFGVNSFEFKVLIGEYDAPERQEQGPVVYDYLSDGNTIIYGKP